MATTEQKLEVKSSSSPDEVRKFAARGQVDISRLSSGDAGLGTFEPGWRWSECVKPLVGTDSCQVRHVGYVLAGRMHIAMDDGSGGDVGPGDFFVMPSGHDAWVLGDEPCRLLDFGGLEGYAQGK